MKGILDMDIWSKLLLAGVGLGITVVFLAPALAAQRRGKAPRFVGVAMAFAGLGVTGLAWLLIGLVTSNGWKIGLGVFALAGLIGAAVGIFFDWKDGKLDRPGQWMLFCLPSLLVVVIVTGNDALPWLADQTGTAIAHLTSGGPQ